MARITKERLFYFLLALVITACVYWGFFYTYLGPRLGSGEAPNLPTPVHIHGLSFLAWYALLLIQALLVVTGGIKMHRWMGGASIALVIVMVASGLVVLGVRMRAGLDGSEPFWTNFSLAVLSNLVLFTVFFVLAILKRNRPASHRRLIIVAAATGSGAAIFRIFMVLIGPGAFIPPAGILATNLFILAAMIGDKAITGKVHSVYRIGLPVAIVVELALMGLAFTEPGVAFQRAMVSLLEPVLSLY